MTLSLSLPESKRIRKPSKRLIEWTEEYDYIFATKKKAKKQPESLQKVVMGYMFFLNYLLVFLTFFHTPNINCFFSRSLKTVLLISLSNP